MKKIFITFPLSDEKGNFRIIYNITPLSDKIDINSLLKLKGYKYVINEKIDDYLTNILNFYKIADPVFFKDLLLDTIDKDKNEREVIKQILSRLLQLTKNENEFKKYLLMLEELSTSRNLKEEIKEAEMGLQNLTWEDLPSYEIGLERGIEKGMQEGIQKGLEKGLIEGEILAYYKLGLDIQTISQKMKLPEEEIKKIIKKHKVNND